jgi:DNA-binding transcriptional LysR family regulator
MDRFHGLENVHLLLGASNIPANYLLPDLLPVLHQQHPGISLQVQMGDSRQVIEAVLQRRLELGLVGARLADDQLHFIPVMTDRLILIVGPDHPLRWSGTISIEQLLEQGLVVREEGSGTYQTLREAFVAQGCDPAALQILARLGSNEAVRRTVAAGFGCAFVSDLSVRESLQRGELYQVAVAGLDIKRQLWLVHLRDRTCSPAAEAVMSLVLEHVSH